MQMKTEITPFETIHNDLLADVGGGNGFWENAKNLGKAAVNGGVNTLNFFHDHPINAGKFGTFSVGGSRIDKPFKDDPLSKVH